MLQYEENKKNKKIKNGELTPEVMSGSGSGNGILKPHPPLDAPRNGCATPPHPGRDHGQNQRGKTTCIKMKSNSLSKSSSDAAAVPGRPTRFPNITGASTSDPYRASVPVPAAIEKTNSANIKIKIKMKTNTIGKESERERSFNASGSANLLSGIQAYVMTPEFQQKLNKTLDPSEVSKAVNRLSMPKCVDKEREIERERSKIRNLEVKKTSTTTTTTAVTTLGNATTSTTRTSSSKTQAKKKKKNSESVSVIMTVAATVV
jgi:hypothetical protein